MTLFRILPARALSQAAWLLLAAWVPALLTAMWHPRRPTWGPENAPVAEVTWSQASGGAGQVLWIDARSATVFAGGHVPGALSLNEAEWEQGLPAVVKAWRPGVKIVVYCDDRACEASQSVARRLRRELGLDEVPVLKGGWRAWLEAQHSKP